MLAICEGRRKSFSDSGDIDLVMRRSLDDGRTWEKMRLIWDDAENTVGNPCPVVDRQTGTVWLPFCWNNRRVLVMKSTDEGVTWSKPVEITKDVSQSRWTWYATGPGHEIQLRSGRLLIPCDHKLDNATKQQPELYYSHVFYSDDHGATWKLGGSVGPHTNECEAVETEDGLVYLNMRSYHGKNRRAYAWSRDGGLTWSEVKLDEALVEPRCQASIARLSDRSGGGKSRILFSNPASTERVNLTVRLSYDECRTWPVSRVLHPGKCAYSDLAVARDMTICCLYERGEKGPYERITLARFNLEWLTGGADRLAGSGSEPIEGGAGAR